MSSKELAKNLIDQIPESKMYYIIAYLQGQQSRKRFPMRKHWNRYKNWKMVAAHYLQAVRRIYLPS